MDDALPEVRYTRSGDVEIAYQVLGSGDIDLVLVMGWLTNLETYWEELNYRRFMQRLAGFTRLILFDKRGMGLSDRTTIGTLEERMDDARAVMDAVGSERAVLMGISEGAPMSLLFAASHPERTAALIFCGGEVKEIRTEDWPWGQSTLEEYEKEMERILSGERQWGRPTRLHYAPSREHDPAIIEWFGRMQRSAASPAAAVAFMRLGSRIDVRHVVPSVRVPTLVLHAPGDPMVPFAQGKWLAEQIPGARFVELHGPDHVPWFDLADEVIAEIRDFLTGFREPTEPEQVLATVLFTDIVDSTDRPGRWETASGAACSRNTTRPCATLSFASGAARSTRPGMASSPPSTGRREESAAHRRSSTRSSDLGYRLEAASTPANAKSWATSWPGSPSTPGRESRRSQARARSWSPRQSAIWSRAPASSSRTAACTS
jgi:pimeloyl-ACP methyl ester carboxylesterase